MASERALVFILLIFFASFTAGCIGTDSLNESFVSDELNKLLPEGVSRSQGPEDREANVTGINDNVTGINDNVTGIDDNGKSITSPGVPEVPTYPEERSGAVYPKEYRILSQNFQRAIGSEEERIKEEVFNITGKNSGYNIEDACAVYNHVNRNWKYRYDKNAEFFFRASQTIDSGYIGDCDDYSIVMSALLKSMGFNTRVVTAYNESYGHAYPELYIGNDRETAYRIMDYVAGKYPFAENIWYSERMLDDGERTEYWLNFDWSGSNGYSHPGGEYFRGRSVIYYPNGLIEF
ncbi:transglutaminase-like domain-containing protein [Methanosarcina hadiensis]|uniref:transglutaminase-like domain-containing protein n=1 Tax=Methanosarcina hadiensis TaxID=3078083 RepID=UPI0039779E12